MFSQGVHPKVVSERLGHASVNITLDTYSHVLPGLQEAAAAALDTILNEPTIPEARWQSVRETTMAPSGQTPERATSCVECGGRYWGSNQ